MSQWHGDTDHWHTQGHTELVSVAENILTTRGTGKRQPVKGTGQVTGPRCPCEEPLPLSFPSILDQLVERLEAAEYSEEVAAQLT